jgi:hypothetical protein
MKTENKYNPEDLAALAKDEEKYKSLGLRFNPFPESGLAPDAPRWNPLEPLGASLWDFVKGLIRSETYKAGVLLGSYGSGKTHHLLWLKAKLDNTPYPLKAIYVSSPGLEPYHLVREVIRQIGKSNFVTLVWSGILPVIREHYKAHGAEYLMTTFYGETKIGKQTVKPRLDLINTQFFSEQHFSDHRAFLEQYDRAFLPRERLRDNLRTLLTNGDTKITDDQLLAQEIASLAVFDEYEAESSWRALTVPAGSRGVYAKGQESEFLLALLTLIKQAGYKYLILLVDEFEGLLVGGRLTSRQVNEYLVTLRHMIDQTWQAFPMGFLFACTSEQWKIISRDLYPAGADRMLTNHYQEFVVPPLDFDTSKRIIGQLLKEAQIKPLTNMLSPMTEEAIKLISPPFSDTPRALIRTCHALLELAVSHGKTEIDSALVNSYIQGTP